jgi:hypothetical protein
MLSASLAKVVKKAAQIADLMTGEDVEADLKVLRDAKKATHHIYDTKKKKLVKVPDHKTRLAATTLSRAYHETSICWHQNHRSDGSRSLRGAENLS